MNMIMLIFKTNRDSVNSVQLKNSWNHLRNMMFNDLREKENENHDRTRENR